MSGLNRKFYGLRHKPTGKLLFVTPLLVVEESEESWHMPMAHKNYVLRVGFWLEDEDVSAETVRSIWLADSEKEAEEVRINPPTHPSTRPDAPHHSFAPSDLEVVMVRMKLKAYLTLPVEN